MKKEQNKWLNDLKEENLKFKEENLKFKEKNLKYKEIVINQNEQINVFLEKISDLIRVNEELISNLTD